MIPATRNQLGNCKNIYQTEVLRVLCVCSAGLLRSPTCANVLHQEYGFNTRAAGSCESFALIPVSQALIVWADEIVFVNRENFEECLTNNPEFETLIRDKAVVLSVPDNFEWNEKSLRAAILRQYKEATEE